MPVFHRSYSSSIDRVAPSDESTIADQIARSLIDDSFTRKVIHRRVTQLLRLAEFASDDEDDFTQEFLIRLAGASLDKNLQFLRSLIDPRKTEGQRLVFMRK